MAKTQSSGTEKCLRAGVTGGIGSGKSTVCAIFSTLGIPVYAADDWAKWLIQHDETVRQGILQLFGPAAYDASGQYNRQFVAQIVFSQADKLAALNALVHPAVERHSLAWHHEKASTGVPYTLREAALLIESGSYLFLDALIVITAPEAIRIQRVVDRDGLSAEAVQARIRRQLPDEEKLRHADYVILNDGEHPLIPQVIAVHKALLERRKSTEGEN